MNTRKTVNCTSTQSFIKSFSHSLDLKPFNHDWFSNKQYLNMPDNKKDLNVNQFNSHCLIPGATKNIHTCV